VKLCHPENLAVEAMGVGGERLTGGAGAGYDLKLKLKFIFKNPAALEYPLAV